MDSDPLDKIREAVDDEHWFNYKNQKRIMLDAAIQIYAAADVTPEQAVREAELLLNAFYKMKMNPRTRRD